MLNIPAEVIGLFKSDSIFKNFHVHFPNGENADLNNDDIVSESVEFTESLCSQQAFRFGLTEASEIKFTCVGVPNIRGVVIECAIEIDVETLGAAWIAAHAPAGTEAFLDPQVCAYGARDMYRVPYGRFIVDTCPRNHEAMWKREVTAYTERLENAITNPFENVFFNILFYEMPTITVAVKPLVFSILNNPDILTENGFVNDGVNTTSRTITNSILVYKNGIDGQMFNLNAKHTITEYRRPSQDDSIATIEWNDVDTSSKFDQIVQYLEDQDIDYARTGYASYEAMAADLMSRRVNGRTEHVTADYPFYVNMSYYAEKSGTQYGISDGIDIPKGSQITFSNPDGISSSIVMTNSVNISVSPYTSQLDLQYSGTPTINYWRDTQAAGNLSFDHTLEAKQYWSISSVVLNVYGYSNAFSMSGLVRGYLELLCRFGSPARSGGFEITGLDNTTPAVLPCSDYSSLWYDETVISPIGYAKIKYMNENGEEQETTVQIGNGYSEYDLTGNEILNNSVFTVSTAEAEAGITIQDKIRTFLLSVFTPNIPDLSFVPIELSKKGLPYLEAGDAISIETYDHQTVPSFILRQVISGIQFLTADVESANGEAMEMIDT